MTLEEVELELSESYSARQDGEVLFVQNVDTQSEFVVEQFGNSLQVRQAVWFGCLELSDTEAARVYRLCSEINGRFSGCKCYVDQWGALITAADILEESNSPRIIEVVLGQVEFVSAATHALVDLVISAGRMVRDEEIDEALQSPSLH